MKMLFYVLFTALGLIFTAANCFAAGSLVIEATGGDQLCDADFEHTCPLDKGCLVQVILDRDGDGLDTIEYSGSIYPFDDDILMPVESGSNTFRIGDGLPPFAEEGQFSVTITFDNEDPAPNYSGYKIYVRFWNSGSPKAGSLYGEAGPFILEQGVKPQVFNILQNGSIFTYNLLK